MQNAKCNNSLIRPFTNSPNNGFTIIEVVVVFLLILGVTFLILPASIDSTKQARFISQWTTKYSELQYTFSVIQAQKNGEIHNQLVAAKNDEQRKDIVIDTIKPYLRITSKVDSTYMPHYMNGEQVTKGGKYYFDTFYNTNDNQIVGLKWVQTDCKQDEACAVMAFDINGTTKPNTWGYDIFGINLLNDKIQPIGDGIQPDILRNDCSKHGFGLYCSYYYLIGGKFD